MMMDQIDAETVEIEIDETGKLWVNVDGICRLRIGKVKEIILDHRSLEPAFPRCTGIVDGKRSAQVVTEPEPWQDDCDLNTPRGG